MLKENVNKCSTLDLDDMVVTHFGMKLEERCFERNSEMNSYSRAITAVRLEIERNTKAETLFPMIAKSTASKTTETNKSTTIHECKGSNQVDGKEDTKNGNYMIIHMNYLSNL